MHGLNLLSGPYSATKHYKKAKHDDVLRNNYVYSLLYGINCIVMHQLCTLLSGFTMPLTINYCGILEVRKYFRDYRCEMYASAL